MFLIINGSKSKVIIKKIEEKKLLFAIKDYKLLCLKQQSQQNLSFVLFSKFEFIIKFFCNFLFLTNFISKFNLK